MAVNQFGRLVAPKDARDLNFLMRSAVPQINKAVGKPKPRKIAYKDGPLLDQGNTPKCVSFSGRGFLDGAPMMSKPDSPPSTDQLYRWCQDRDEWPGSDYDGTSVRALMKSLCEAGLVKSYVWGQTCEDMANWLLGNYGTIIVGTNWYAEMSWVDEKGFMREPAPSFTTPIGGHAYRVTWYDKLLKCFIIRNSWGTDFGWLKNGVRTGYARVSIPLMTRLLDEDGEVAAPTQVKVSAVLP